MSYNKGNDDGEWEIVYLSIVNTTSYEDEGDEEDEEIEEGVEESETEEPEAGETE